MLIEKLMFFSGGIEQTHKNKSPSITGIGMLLAAVFALIAAANVSTWWTVNHNMYVASRTGNDGTNDNMEPERDWSIPVFVALLMLFSRALYLDATANPKH